MLESNSRAWRDGKSRDAKRNCGIVPAHSKLSIRHTRKVVPRTRSQRSLPLTDTASSGTTNIEIILNCAAESRPPTTRSPRHSRRRSTSHYTASRTLKPTSEALHSSPAYEPLLRLGLLFAMEPVLRTLERPRSEHATKICKSFLAPSSAKLLSSVPCVKAG